ncbi:MAG: hypothetical protein ACPHO4_04745 [Longimicrobiales bacterium]
MARDPQIPSKDVGSRTEVPGDQTYKANFMNESRTHPVHLQVVNVVVLVLVLWANAAAGSGALSGESIGVVANRHASYFLPANYVFGIWSLIYLGVILFVMYQALPVARASASLAALGWGWAANGALNIVWVVLFSFSMFVPAWLVMIALLMNLIWIHERIGFGTRPHSWIERVCLVGPFGLYLAWISVALISNTSQLVTYVGWNGFGISGPVWSAIMMLVATALSAFMVVHRGNWLFPVVFAWAFVGLASRYAEIPVIANTAYVTSAAGLAVLAGVSVWRWSQGAWSTAGSRP